MSQLIKGESSFWLNNQKLLLDKFQWQDDYFAISVSQSQLSTVVNYIKKQEEKHGKESFLDEVDEFVKIYGFENIKD